MVSLDEVGKLVRLASMSATLRWAYGLVLLGLVAWLASCNQSVPPAENEPTATSIATIAAQTGQVEAQPVTPTNANCVRGALSESSEIVIGALVPLSQPGNILIGFAMQAAFNIAIDELKANGGVAGKPVRFVTYDTSNDAQRGALYAERLITLDCATILVGAYHSQVALAVKDVAHKYGIPVIFVATYADELTAQQEPEVFRISPSITMMAQAPANWMSAVGDFNADGTNLAVSIVENGNENVVLSEETKRWFEASSIVAQRIGVDLPTTDFSPVLARIVALDHIPDVIFISLPGEVAFDFQQQVLAAGIGPQQKTILVSNTTAVNETLFWSKVPGGVFTVLPRLGPWTTTVSTMGAQFAEKYRAYFDHWPEGAAFLAYDSIHLAADAITRANSLEPSAIIAALEASDIELAAGRYSFEFGANNPPDGVEEPASYWHQWMDSPYLYLQYSSPNQPASNAAVIWPPIYRTIKESILRP